MTATAAPGNVCSPRATPRHEATPTPIVTPTAQSWTSSMPRLSDIVSGWENAGDIVPEEGSGEDSIAPHRRKVVRTLAAAAGPHPYLDRFASGMHRPLEGGRTKYYEIFGLGLRGKAVRIGWHITSMSTCACWVTRFTSLTRSTVVFNALFLYGPSRNAMKSATLTSVIGGSGSVAYNAALAYAPLGGAARRHFSPDHCTMLQKPTERTWVKGTAGRSPHLPHAWARRKYAR